MSTELRLGGLLSGTKNAASGTQRRTSKLQLRPKKDTLERKKKSKRRDYRPASGGSVTVLQTPGVPSQLAGRKEGSA